MTFRIGPIDIERGKPCRFVAEISNNHNGDFDRALRLIGAARDAGADLVKFQCYTPDELVTLRGDCAAPEPWGSQGFTMRSLYEKAATPLDWFPKLFQHARDIGIVPFSSVFGLESLLVLERCACPAYKIARLDNMQSGLRDAVLSRRKPLLVSVETRGMIPVQGYSLSGDEMVATLYCPPGYPTPAENVRLVDFVEWGGDKNGARMIGLSSHCLDPLLPIAAVARGCGLIEMHFQLDDEPSELEANVSLTASQFAQMVRDVRKVEAMLA